jgi:hypothetical protein
MRFRRSIIGSIIVGILAAAWFATTWREDPADLIRRLEAGGAQVRPVSERFIPEVELQIRVDGHPVVARRYPSGRVAARASGDRGDSLVDGRWVFVAERIDVHRPHEALRAVRKALAIPEPKMDPTAVADAARVLKEIFAAQVQFQGGSYLDQDADQVGEYGFLSELSGGRVRTDTIQPGTLRLLPYRLLSEPAAALGDYSFTMYLRAGSLGWVAAPAQDPLPAALRNIPWQGTEEERRQFQQRIDLLSSNDRERYFLCVAWPTSSPSGTMLAMTQDGIVRAKAFAGSPPRPEDVLTGGDPYAAPSWPALAP